MRRSSSTASCYRDLAAFREGLQGTKDVKKVLIANNGLAAVKGIRSIRAWLYDHLGDEEAIQFAVMATPEDLKANAEFINLADQHVEVAGGSNANNYANVELIVQTALQLGCDAVYPGWGHASENPALPRELEKTRKVIFLGPPEAPMFALGDKIASTIIAQSNGVPTVPWSGDHITLVPNTFQIDPLVYEQAYVKTAEECVEVCSRVGLPIMIKASEGGGGKGIRKVLSMADVEDSYRAVTEEVKGCHVFVMRLLENVRHLEVQLLADKYGNCIAVRTRDCSVQRRHQKIIEEAPVVGVDPSVILDMEQSAIRLALAVGYVGLGTVEYMFDKNTGKFSFLELNPRIQVEHPVSELISGVNLPAALLCTGMGIPLYRIPEVRALYGEDPYGSSVIDFATRVALSPRCHAIAVRITAEDVDEGFRPTTGSIDEISFRNSKECWGYFSVSGGGGSSVHQFADSQFGHVFSTGETREDARRGMVLALRGLTIRGEIRTSTAYIVELLEKQEFRDCNVSTAWLDGLITQRMRTVPDAHTAYPALVAASIHRMKRFEESNLDKYNSFLQAGHTPSADYLSNCRVETFVLHSQKYMIEARKLNLSDYSVSLNGCILVVPCRQLNSGGLQLTVGGRALVAYCEEEPTSLRVTINGKATTFTGDVDPTKLRSSVPGRLVRFLIPDGGHIDENSPFAEVEVMKMILQLRSAVSGTVTIRATAGSTVTIGRLLAEVEPDDASKVARPTTNSDPWPDYVISPSGTSNNSSNQQPRSPVRKTANGGGTTVGGFDHRVDAVTRARDAIDTIWFMMQGYMPDPTIFKERLAMAIDGLSTLTLSGVQLRLLNRPYFSPEQYPNASTPIEKLKAFFDCIVGTYLGVEKHFDGLTRQEAIDRLRSSDEASASASSGSAAASSKKSPSSGGGGNNGPAAPSRVYELDFAHHHLHRHDVMKALLQYMELNRLLMLGCRQVLEELGRLQSATYGAVLLQARYLLRQCSLPSFDDRKGQLGKELEEGNVETLMQGSYGFDLMCAVMFDPRSPHLTQLALELFIRRSHYGLSIVENIDIYKTDGVQSASFRFDELPDQDPLYVQEQSSLSQCVVEEPASGTGFVALFVDEADLMKKFDVFAERVLSEGQGNVVATVFFSVRPDTTTNAMTATCAEVISHYKKQLNDTLVESLTFIIHGATGGPHIFTYRRSLCFEEETLSRNLVPTSARRLELKRLSNYDITMFPTPHRHVHIYTAAPKGGKYSPVEYRLFVRMFVSPRDLGIAPWSVVTEIDAGHALERCIAAVEFARADKKISQTVFNHLFINMLELTFNVTTAHKLFKGLAETYAKKLYSLGIREVELKFNAKTGDGSLIPFRTYLMNHTGYALAIRTYIETYSDGVTSLRRAEHQEDIDDLPGGSEGAQPFLQRGVSMANLDFVPGSSDDVVSGGTRSDQGIHTTSPLTGSPAAHSSASNLARRKSVHRLQLLRNLLPPRPEEGIVSNDSIGAMNSGSATSVASFDSDTIRLEPYPALPPKQVKRLQAQALQTTYARDWVVLFEVALRQKWREFTAGRKLPMQVVPQYVVHAQQLFAATLDATKLTTEPAKIPCGMLVFEMEYSPPSYFNASTGCAARRSVIVAANDITFQSGSFAVPEDVVFKLACDYAREKRIPFIYLSANSGARLGLCEAVKQKFRVALQNDSVDYIYLTEADYAELTETMGIKLTVKARQVGDERRLELLDIIGSDKEFLGVENLQGSALIAGQMSLNYATIPTISVATGRTVGIGAYLVRLGRRVVQVRSAPIILTGSAALNRLLGKEVYTDNCQLGGSQIMVPNGVTHWEAKDDLCAIHTVLRWLDYVPAVCGGGDGAMPSSVVPRRLAFPVVDPVDRDVTYVPRRDESYDPRALVEGTATTSGLFDKGSWQEALAGWAKTVVVGRATLGGIPCGVILVETRITKKFDPADPADPTSISSFSSQAGQVWFPDSARKTADALEDFHKEQLPCFVLANWRGFSGGMRDMYDEVLKFGASIVDNLRTYTAPVFVYIPPYGELRGGAWVVVDPVINHSGVVQMFCDETARGGILEPSGVVEIKFRENDVRDVIRRSDAQVQSLQKSDPQAAKKREAHLLPLYNDVAVHFADLHDTPGRMVAKKTVTAVVPWRDSRRIFSVKLERRLLELGQARVLTQRGDAPTTAEALTRLRDLFVSSLSGTSAQYDTNDAVVAAWLRELESSGRLRATAAQQAATSIRRNVKIMSAEERLQCLAGILDDEELLAAVQEALQRKVSNEKKL